MPAPITRAIQPTAAWAESTLKRSKRRMTPSAVAGGRMAMENA